MIRDLLEMFIVIFLFVLACFIGAFALNKWIIQPHQQRDQELRQQNFDYCIKRGTPPETCARILSTSNSESEN